MKEISMKILDSDKVWDFVRNNENPLMMSGHIGTHIDVYNKSEIPQEYIERRGVIIDCGGYSYNQDIGVEVLKNISLRRGDFVIFFTDIQKISKYGEEIYIKEHHQLSWELIEKLLEIEVSFIGIDCAGIRRGKEHIEADKKCEMRKIFVIENLDSNSLENLEQIIDTLIVWHRTPLLTGLPVRIFVKGK